MTKIKSVIYGAAFNPISYAHLLTAEIVMNRRNIDKVLFTPSSFKRRDKSKNLISDEHRLEMVKMAIEDNEKFDYCDIELTNPAWESKTEIVLKKYKEKNPDEEVYFLMGADNLQTLSTWDNSTSLVRDNKFIVVARDGYDMLEIIATNPLLSKYEENFDLIHKGIQMDISSTLIRDNASINKSMRYLLPDKCIQYIKENNLYSN
jgi:nicotinate-nucleotide adenylyltransferase